MAKFRNIQTQMLFFTYRNPQTQITVFQIKFERFSAAIPAQTYLFKANNGDTK